MRRSRATTARRAWEAHLRRVVTAAALLALGCALVTGCGKERPAAGGAPEATSPSVTSSSGDPAGSGVEEMQKKVDAAESAAAAADRDAAEDSGG